MVFFFTAQGGFGLHKATRLLAQHSLQVVWRVGSGPRVPVRTHSLLHTPAVFAGKSSPGSISWVLPDRPLTRLSLLISDTRCCALEDVDYASSGLLSRENPHFLLELFLLSFNDLQNYRK